MEGARTAQAGGAAHHVALYGHLGWEPSPLRSTLLRRGDRPVAPTETCECLGFTPCRGCLSRGGRAKDVSPLRATSSLPSGSALPFVGATHASPLQRPVYLNTQERESSLSPALQRGLPLRPAQGAVGSGSGGGAARRRGHRGRMLTEGWLGAPDPGTVRNAGCPALVARRDDANFGRGEGP